MWSVIVLDLELQQVYFAAENVNQWDAMEIINGLTEKDCLIAAIPADALLDAWTALFCQQRLKDQKSLPSTP